MPCSFVDRNLGDIEAMAMAALPENIPEARVLVVDDETNIVELALGEPEVPGLRGATPPPTGPPPSTRPVRSGPTPSSST